MKNNNRIFVDSILNYINPNTIKAINVLKDSTIKKKYGSRATNGVIEITLNEDSVFLSVEKILSDYKIHTRLQELPLYINGKLIPEEQLFLDRSDVKRVRLVKKREGSISKKLIEVTTIHPYPLSFKKSPETIDSNMD